MLSSKLWAHDSFSVSLTWLHLSWAFTFIMSFLIACPFFNHLNFKLVTLLNELSLSCAEDTKIKSDFIGFPDDDLEFIFPLVDFHMQSFSL